jgi:hypothetical protein
MKKKTTTNVWSTFVLAIILGLPLTVNAQNTAWPAPGATANVGIGTTTPTGKLSVVTTTANDGIDITQSSSGSATLALMGVSGHNYRFWSTGTGNTGGAGNFQLVDQTAARTNLFINGSNGFIGLGGLTASNMPTAQLHTLGTVRFQGITTDNTMNEVVVLDANGNLAKRSYPTGTTLSCGTVNYIPKVTGAGILNCSQLYDDGTNIGIGTASPTAKFSVVSSTTNDGIDIRNTNTGSATLALQGDGGSNWRLWSTGTANTGGAGNFQLVDQTASRTAIFINGSNGFIGLGGLNPFVGMPTAQLHTLGTVRFQGITTDNTMNEVVVLDANGNLAKRAFPSTGATLSCSSVNYLSKVTGSGVLNCSQIFDDGTSVGIGTNTGFTYSGGGAVLSTGGSLPGTITLKVNGLTTADAFVATSDKRFKKDIKPIENALDKINKLTGVTYNWRADEFKERKFNNTSQLGLIAQEVEKVIPEAVIIDENGFYGVNYNMVIPVLMEAIKEQQTILNDQKSRIEALESSINSIQTSRVVEKSFDVVRNEEFRLEQNVPNPFSQSTSIQYFVPVNAGKASVIICDLSGKMVKSIELKESGAGSVSVSTDDLQSGIFIYALVVNGKEIVSKRMVVTK